MSEYIVTLISDPTKHRLHKEHVEALAATLDARELRWLSEGEACDVWVEGWHQGTEHLLKLGLGPLPIDFVVQRPGERKRKLLISDMDSTMITVECIDELADFVGKKAYVAKITERAMNGELQFEQALIERVALLKGLLEATLQQCYDERVKMMPGAAELVGTMRRDGAHTVLVSGGFTFFTSRVRQQLGFHEDYSNLLEVQEGVLTGRVIPPILGKEAKLETLKRTVKRLGITPADVLAVGDGANDLPMLLAAGTGVAYHAKPSVQEQVQARINHGSLRALLFVQGYMASEIRS